MTVSYEQILGGRNDLTLVNFANASPPVASIGRRFVLGASIEGLTPATKMPQITKCFHLLLAGRGWIWEPTVAGASYVAGAKLLDGKTTCGECGSPAYALAYIVNAPPPYGFGAGGASVVTYSGSKNCGFISNHIDGLPGPKANITRPDGRILQNFYSWDNHKVVLFNGQYYDPCYNKVYETPQGMAAASFDTIRRHVRLRDLKTYDPLNPWGLLLAWGFPRLMALKLSDLVYHNTHDITILRAVDVQDQQLNGYYIVWEETWGRSQFKARAATYGPLVDNPLAR